MANEYYATGSNRAAKVAALFDHIAPRYDLINDLQSFGLHRWWKRKLVRLAALKPGEHALDLCCGTGDIVFRLASQGAAVTGLDFSEPMLQVAKRRLAQMQPTPPATPAISFQHGDAQKLPFPDARFDAVTVAYGLRNLTSWESGLAEMYRVAKPGGCLLVLDFGKPDNAAWRWMYFQYLRWLVPIFGRLFCKDAAAYAYILESLKHFPAQHGIAQNMRDLGCQDVRVHNLLGGVMGLNYGVKPRK
ncbi:MAG: bifunctional demethylmenaquinone methyltransferase/2-methoxy-6-polyprenyl-1,4-benzoquinol methylase UbiE [Verrucomicrobiota bacterium]